MLPLPPLSRSGPISASSQGAPRSDPSPLRPRNDQSLPVRACGMDVAALQEGSTCELRRPRRCSAGCPGARTSSGRVSRDYFDDGPLSIDGRLPTTNDGEPLRRRQLSTIRVENQRRQRCCGRSFRRAPSTQSTRSARFPPHRRGPLACSPLTSPRARRLARVVHPRGPIGTVPKRSIAVRLDHCPPLAKGRRQHPLPGSR